MTESISAVMTRAMSAAMDTRRASYDRLRSIEADLNGVAARLAAMDGGPKDIGFIPMGRDPAACADHLERAIKEVMARIQSLEIEKGLAHDG